MINVEALDASCKKNFSLSCSFLSDSRLIIISHVLAKLLLDHFFLRGHSKNILAIFEYDLSFRVEQN
jgi:hypothetical protein